MILFVHGSRQAGIFMTKAKKWAINILILVIATVVMLIVAEAGMRWIDGYRLSTIELNQDATTIEQAE